MKKQYFLAITLLTLFTENLYAGGIGLSDARINGHPIDRETSVEVPPNTRVELCALMEAYIFGRPRDSAYVIFQISDLMASSPNGIYLTFAKPVEQSYRLQYCIDFQAPAKPGIFVISYSHEPMFRSDFRNFTEINIDNLAAQHLKQLPRASAVIGRIVVMANGQARPEIATYLKLNGRVPGVDAHVEAGMDKDPIVFSWFVRPNIPHVKYRYRLYPDETDWSDWTAETEITEYFMPVGAHQFQVETRVETPSGGSVETKRAEYGFILEKPFIAKPIKKASLATNVKSSVTIDINRVYSRSRALLIGVTRYNDKQFGPLPYTAQDVRGVDAALRNVGFTVSLHELGP